MTGSLENFTLLGGPLQRLGARLALVRGGNTLPLGLALGWLSWIILAALSGAGGGGDDFFSIAAISIHARLLLAIPLLFSAETALDAKLREFVSLLVASGIAGPRALPQLEKEAARLSDWENSWLPDAASLSAAVALTIFAVDAGLPPSGRALEGVPLAGAFYALFCLPLFRFLMFRWLLRILLWWSLLWRLSRMDLALAPAHPDGAGGLGYLETVHTRFAPIALAFSLIVAANLCEDITRGASTLSDAYPELGATLLIDCILFLAPLCLFVFKLRACQEKGLRDYGVLGARYAHAFDAKWLSADSSDAALLGTADLQSLADLANSVEVVRKMRLAPISLRLLVVIGLAAILPMIPLFLFDYPVTDLAKLLFEKLAGL